MLLSIVYGVRTGMLEPLERALTAAYENEVDEPYQNKPRARLLEGEELRGRVLACGARTQLRCEAALPPDSLHICICFDRMERCTLFFLSPL
jgi:hypothetical protein